METNVANNMLPQKLRQKGSRILRNYFKGKKFISSIDNKSK